MRVPRPRKPPEADESGRAHDLHVEDLAVRAADGDQECLSELYKLYADKTLRLIAGRTASLAVAEDLTSELWLRVTRNMSTYKTYGPGSFTRFTYTIAMRLLASHYKAVGRSKDRVDGNWFLADGQAVSANPDEQAVYQDGRQQIAQALMDLTADQRECILLRFYQDLTLSETAKIMGREPNAIKQLQFRACGKLRERLPRELRDCVYGATLTLPVPGVPAREIVRDLAGQSER